MTHLIYINELGPDFKGERIYEFIFSDKFKVSGDDWDLVPAAGRAMPPDIEYVKLVGSVRMNLKLDLVQNSDYFSVFDAVDGVIALGWESYDADDEPVEDKRMVFKFGESLDSVKTKLSQRLFEFKTQKIEE